MSYTTATFTRITKNPDDGKLVIYLTYTGNAGEPPVEYAYPIDAAAPPSGSFMRGLAMQRLGLLNNNIDFRALVLPFVGTVLDTTTPLPTPPASTFGAFFAATAPFTPGATPQDVFTLTGSATRRVSVLAMGLLTTQNTAGYNAWSLVKRSTANTGGTSAAVTAVPSDDSYPAATAVVQRYTANPTLGSLIGNVWSGRVASPVVASAPAGDLQRVVSLPLIGQVIVLTGITDVLAWNFGGVALPAGLSVQAFVSWQEG